MKIQSAITNLDIHNPPLEGVNLIEASAGTGKTYAIAAIYLHLVLARQIPVENILVVTFTVSATEELKGRIRSRLRSAHQAFSGVRPDAADPDRVLLENLLKKYSGDADSALKLLDEALRNFDRSAVHTIHGFCRRLLQENAFESSALFDTELVTDDGELLEETAADFLRREIYNAPAVVARRAAGHGISHNGLIRLLKSRPLDPRAIMVPRPRRPEIPEIEAAVAEAQTLFEDGAALWEKTRNEIREAVTAAVIEKRLHGGKIRLKNLEDKITSLDAFFDAGDPTGRGDSIDFFTSSRMEKSANSGKEPPRHEFLSLWDRYCEQRAALDGLVSDLLLSLKLKFLETAEASLSRAGEIRNTRTFNELLTQTHRALGGNAFSPLAVRMRRRYTAALIDEFQDTDPLQYEIFSTVFDGKESSLYMIGDPKQAIYKFRGADIFAYLRAARDCDRRYSLAVNYRSDPGLVESVNTIFGHPASGGNPFVLPGIGFTSALPSRPKPKGPAVPAMTVWFIDEKYADHKTTGGPTGKLKRSTALELAARSTAEEIARLLASGESAGDIAVLVRKHRQADIVTGHLRSLGIPCVAYGTDSVFHTREALEMERMMESAADPSDTGLLNAALATDFWGKTGNEIRAIISRETELSLYASRAADFRAAWESGGFMAMFRAMLRELNVRTRLISLEDGERRLTNVLHLGEVLHGAEREKALGVEGLLKWFRGRRAEADLGEETNIRLETDEKAVKVITMHKSKGLEFPLVFCPCLFDPVTIKGDFSFHHPDDENRLVVDLGTDGEEKIFNTTRALTEELSENLRLMYVALTRAKSRCWIAWGHIDGTELSAPFYAFHHHRVSDWEKYLEQSRLDSKDRDPSYKLLLEYNDKLADMKELEKISDGALSVIPLPAGKVPPYRAAASAMLPQCREFRGNISRRWRLTSFSSLIHSAHTYSPPRDSELRERDSIGAVPERRAFGTGIHDFPRGTRAGNFIHSVFERIDFSVPLSDAARNTIAAELRGYRFDEKWAGAIETMTHNVLSAPLSDGDSDFRLCNITDGRKLAELDFQFPMGDLTPAGLARLVLGERGDLPGDAADIITRLGMDRVKGFLRGFIDLVFSHNGRYYILDWKSNHLGDDAGQYTRERLAGAMADNLYHLQYHIYAVALHRHLGRALPGYDYDRHFGGAFYLFVRGVDPKSPGCGVFHDRPDRALMEKLDAYFREGDAHE